MLVRKNFSEADEVRSIPHGRLEVVKLPGQTLARAVMEPGWRWSQSIKPMAGTASCEIVHTGYVISGRMRVRMDDGSETEYGPGDAQYVSAGHDAWVVGDETLVVLDIVGAADLVEVAGGTEAAAAPATA